MAKKNDVATEVRIGIVDSPALGYEIELSAEKIAQAVSAALEKKAPLIFNDVKGHQVIIPAERITFVEIGTNVDRKVGFTF